VTRIVPAGEAGSAKARRSSSCGVMTRVATSRFKPARARRAAMALREAATRSTSGGRGESATDAPVLLCACGDGIREAVGPRGEDAAAFARDDVRCDDAEDVRQVPRACALRAEPRGEDRRPGEQRGGQADGVAVDGGADDEPDRTEAVSE